MTKVEIPAVVLTVGRYSEREFGPDNQISWYLSDCSRRRSEIFAEEFIPDIDPLAIASGGWPGFENWPPEHIPPVELREGPQMTEPLRERLRSLRWTESKLMPALRLKPILTALLEM